MKSLSIRKITFIFIVIFAVFLAYCFSNDVWELLKDQAKLINMLEKYPVAGLFGLFIGQFLQVFIPLIPGPLLIVVTSQVYGFLWGVILNISATVIASQLAFLLARKFGLPFVKRFVPGSLLSRFLTKIERQGTWFYLIAYNFPSSDVLSFAAGLTSISPQLFLVLSFLGRLPTVIFLSLLGDPRIHSLLDEYLKFVNVHY